MLSCGFVAIKTTGYMLVAALNVHGARFGARGPIWVRVAEPLLLRFYCYAMQRYRNTRRLPHTVHRGK